jgi:hypothetical protein
MELMVSLASTVREGLRDPLVEAEKMDCPVRHYHYF